MSRRQVSGIDMKVLWRYFGDELVDGVTALAALKVEALLVGNAKTGSRRGPRMESEIPNHLVLGQIPENLAGPLATTFSS